jgi:hypothetical protein
VDVAPLPSSNTMVRLAPRAEAELSGGLGCEPVAVLVGVEAVSDGWAGPEPSPEAQADATASSITTQRTGTLMSAILVVVSKSAPMLDTVSDKFARLRITLPIPPSAGNSWRNLCLARPHLRAWS